MIKIVHPSTPEDIEKIDKLSSTVFLSHKPGESMVRRYRSLFSLDNREHINVVFEGEEAVTNVNWYSSQVKCGESLITAGQIGGVCSHERVRGQGNAELLLLYSFFQMREEGVSLCFISGDGKLYKKQGARYFGTEYHFTWNTPTPSEMSVDVEIFEGENMVKAAGKVYRFHAENYARFIRPFGKIKEQLLGFAEPHHGARGVLYTSDFAYVMTSVSDDEGAPVTITEFGGLPEDVIRLFGVVVEKTGKELAGRLEPWQKEDYEILPIEKTEHLDGTVVILDPVRLFRQLKERFQRAGLGNVALIPDGFGYRIFIGDREFLLSEDELYEAIFMGDERFGTAFPLPLPSLSSMDYQ